MFAGKALNLTVLPDAALG
jgi:hypothetical protein